MYSIIKINCFSNGYWYYPKILTFSKWNWSSKPYKTLDELFNILDLKDKPYKVSSNGGECTIDVFNFVQAKNLYNFKLDKKQIYEKDFLHEEEISDKLKVIWNYKSIKKIISGSIPFVSKEWLIKEFETADYASIYWTGNTFTWFKNK